MTPSGMNFAAPSRPQNRARPRLWFLMISVIVLGVFATGFACQLTRRDLWRNDQERFASQADKAKDEFDQTRLKYFHALREVREWIGWIETPELTEWENRLEQMNLRWILPGLARIGYAPQVDFIRRWNKTLPQHWPDTQTIDKLPTFLGPASVPTRTTNSSRRHSNNLFYDTRLGDWKESTSEPPIKKGTILPIDGESIALIRNNTNKLKAVRAFLPVWSAKVLPLTNSISKVDWDRMRDYGRPMGTVVAELALEPMLPQSPQNSHIVLELIAASLPNTNGGYKLDQASFSRSFSDSLDLQREYEISWFGMQSILVVRPTPEFWRRSNHTRLGWVGAAGVILTFSLAGFLWMEGTGRTRAEELNAELSRARDDLRTVQAARDQLQRNLHDAVLQRLYAAALHARQTWQAAVHGKPVASEEIASQVSELDAAMTDLRSFLGGPAQRELSETKLASALHGLAQAFSRQTGVAVRLDAAPATLAQLPLEARAQLLPIVREGLSNAWRHGHASEITLTVSSAAGDVTVTVTDDGGGFDPASVTPGGRGLKNLAERAAESGGTFRVESQTGGPTTLCFEWKGGGDEATA